MTRHLPSRWVPAALILFVVATSCAKGDDPADDSTDLPPRADGGPNADGSSRGDSGGACMLGTPDDCGACGHVCPGVDDTTTVRTCSGADATGTCNILCRGENYDVDGKPDNGCEAADPIVQDSATTAVVLSLPDIATADPTMKSNPLNVVAPLYGDTRSHETNPILRPLGREDWYKVTAVGAGVPGSGMIACLSAGNFPKDNELEICISASGATTFDATGCKTLVVATAGGSGQCVSPSGNPSIDSGTFMVRVRRTKGTTNANQYALYLRH